ncbi:hypothetical protein [Mucilaginibacter antarcticus]|uniref:Colicin import membrane protein n=1 Tax=Mucilaginibacter antarcticus TaxID=1855725 RepID=A0ABW5XTS8_9SPHI
MKNILKIALVTGGMLAAMQGPAWAQENKPVGKQITEAGKDVGNATATAAKDVGKTTAKGAKAVGKKTSQLASKGAAAVTDKRYNGHWAQTGELVYIDEYNRYFYVDKKGHRQFITKVQMRTTKP